MPEQTRLIVVDDEPELCAMVAEYLGKHGFDVRIASGGRELDEHLAQRPADMLVLDVNMPGEDGFAVARRLRASSDVAILMLTAADEVVDRVVGLELGADDYLSKPFDLRELRARLGAIRRRRQPAAGLGNESAAKAGAAARPPHIITFGAVTLDLEKRVLVRPDGAEMPLTALEFELLQVFARNPNRVLTRERLLDLAHRGDNDPFDRSIDIRITRIRKKVEADPAKPVAIKTVRGAGYMFVPLKA